jgi:pyrroline-5-carboxylate reductase
MLAGKKLGVIGVGKLGEALVSGLLKESVIRKEDIVGSVHYENSIARVKERLGIDATMDNRAVTQNKDVVLLAVKPQNMDLVVREIAPVLQPNQVLITVAASVPTTFVEERLGKISL